MILNYERVVVGNDFESVIYAFVHQLPLISTTLKRPFRFDYCGRDYDWGCVKLSSSLNREIITHDKVYYAGVSKELLWERLLFLMGLKGLLPLGGIATSIRWRTDNTMVASGEYAKVAEITYEECYLINQKSLEDEKITCYDWIAFNRGGKHDIDLIETADKFVNHIWFYPSDRIAGNTGVKDACAVSYLSPEQLLGFDCAETMARFKVVHEMKARGMKGLYNGLSPTGTPKYYDFKTSFIDRERNTKSHNPFAPPTTKNIQYKMEREADLFTSLPSACVEYNRFLKHL